MDARNQDHVGTRRDAHGGCFEPTVRLTDTATGRTTREGGFALPIVIYGLILLGVIGVAAIQTSRDELLSAKAVSGSSQAFYAAEAGIHSAVSNWDAAAMDTLVAGPGDSLVGSWTTIENRCAYRLVYRRIDGGDTQTRIYSVESTGQSPGLNGGRRRVGIIMKDVAAVAAALVFGGDAELSGNPTISGACSDIHSNGDLDIPGSTEVEVGANVSSSGSASVGGDLEDADGDPVSPTSGAPEVPIPDLDPTDYCGEADYIFTGQMGLKVSTSELRNLNSGTHWGWKWAGGKYQTDNDNVEPGVYCMDNDVEVGNQLGSAGSPLAITFLTTASVTIPGDPYIVSAHSDSILIMAEGDVNLNGSPSGGDLNFEGLIYAGSQCEVSGTPALFGQLICKDDPNPAGSEDWVSANKISGDMELTYSCGGLLAGGQPVPIAGRMWNHVW